MSANKTIIKRFFNEVVNQRRINILDEIIHKDFVNHGFPIPAKGPEAMKQIANMMISAFPDLQITLEGVLEDAETNSVTTRGFWKGTHKGNFMDIPPTGKEVKVSYIDIWNTNNGKIHENWVQMDFVSLMQQIGVLPSPK